MGTERFLVPSLCSQAKSRHAKSGRFDSCSRETLSSPLAHLLSILKNARKSHLTKLPSPFSFLFFGNIKS